MVAHDYMTQVTVSTEAVEYLLAYAISAKDEKAGILVYLDGLMYLPTVMGTAK